MKNDKGITLIALILIILLLLVLAGITVALVVANENIDDEILTPQTQQGYEIEEKTDTTEELPSELPGNPEEPIPGSVVEETNTAAEETVPGNIVDANTVDTNTVAAN